MKSLLLLLFVMLALTPLRAQDQWSLQRCIQYAVEHNINIQQAELNKRLNELQLKQIQNSKYPNFNLGLNNGISNGRSVDPTTNLFINNTYYFNGLSASSSVLLFGAFQRKYQEEQAKLDVEAIKWQNKQLQNDIALNISAAYLRALLAMEQLKNVESQLTNDQEQLNNTEKRAKAGLIPELNVMQVKALLMNDSSNYISSKGAIAQALLELKALLNLSFEQSFSIELPDLNSVLLKSNYPAAEQVYQTALGNQPGIQFQNIKLKSVEKNIALAKTGFYPQVQLSYSAGTNFANTVKQITGSTYIGDEEIAAIKFGDTSFPVTRPIYSYTTATVPLFKQYDNNFRQTLNLGINIPIFNNYNNKTNLDRAKINLHLQSLQKDAEYLKLKQNIYLAFNDFSNAKEKYKAARQASSVEQLAFDYASKRYETGFISSLEYVSQQNNLAKAKNNESSAKYDMLFKAKIIEFYMGEQLKL